LSGRELDNGLYEIDSIPFYALLLSSADRISVSLHDGQLIFEDVVLAGGHSTIRVIAYDERIVPDIRSRLKQRGCLSELSNVPSFFAIDIPPDADYAAVVHLLAEDAKKGLLDYEESSLQHDAPGSSSDGDATI
jgi:Domain of unknown function (DUF4265)